MSEETPAKVPTRPGSKWATGRRVKQEPLVERDGFSKGARVSRRAPAQAAPKTKHRRKRK